MTAYCCVKLTRQSLLWDGDPAQWGFQQTEKESGWFLWFSFHTSLRRREGQRALYPRGILLSCRWYFLQSAPCQDKDIAQYSLAEGVGVAQGHRAVEANMAAGWQLVKIWLCCFSCSLFFCYLCLKCHRESVLTELWWSQQYRKIVREKNPSSLWH